MVTGASSGIGLAYAQSLCSYGFDCVLVAFDDDNEIQDVADQLATQYSVKTLGVNSDIGVESNRNQIIELANSWDTSVLVNCAGYGVMGYFTQHSFASYVDLINTNEIAAIHFCHNFCERMLEAERRGAVINVSSINADFDRGIPFSAVYSSGKSMLRNFTEAIAFELKPYNIDILNVSPGPTRTAFQERAKSKTLWFSETPESVVRKTFSALGRKHSVTTNTFARLFLTTFKLLPLGEALKIRLRALYFRSVLGNSRTYRI